MKTGEAEHWLHQQLQDFYSPSESNAIATWVFEKVTGLPRLERVKQRDVPLTTEAWQQLTAIAERLRTHEPVQYVLEEAYFQGLKLFVDASVLIPRPETEELVDWILHDVKKSGKPVFESTVGIADKTRSLKILDVGTGSGCIALALENKMPKAEVWGCDSSDAALNVARRNGATLDIRVDFQQIDLLDQAQWNNLPFFDLVASNPPYITIAEEAAMPQNVVRHEPHIALFVPDANPLLFYETLGRFGRKKLHDGGSLYVEIHEERGGQVVELFQNLMYTNVELRKDMQGKNRMVKAIKSNSD